MSSFQESVRSALLQGEKYRKHIETHTGMDSFFIGVTLHVLKDHLVIPTRPLFGAPGGDHKWRALLYLEEKDLTISPLLKLHVQWKNLHSFQTGNRF